MVDIFLDASCLSIYPPPSIDPEGDSCFTIYQISWIEVKKVTFCKLKTSLSRNFVHNLQAFGGFCLVHVYNFLANSA